MPTDEQLIDASVTAAGLGARYSQPHRRYHTAVHVEHVLRTLEELSPLPGDMLSLQLAAWFHDAVYAPGRDDNEERSAFLARDTLELVGGSPALGTEVARLISLTATHDPAPDDRSGAVFCDADLSILGSSQGSYAGYAAAIREEFSLAPDVVFRPGRAKILRQFLQRPQLFHTPTGRERWEASARVNLQREIDELEGTLQ